jgi:hypothetical protein
MEYLGKGEMLTNRDVNNIVTIFVCMEHFWDLLFQLMKHGINTLQYIVIFLVQCIWLAKMTAQATLMWLDKTGFIVDTVTLQSCLISTSLVNIVYIVEHKKAMLM